VIRLPGFFDVVKSRAQVSLEVLQRGVKPFQVLNLLELEDNLITRLSQPLLASAAQKPFLSPAPTFVAELPNSLNKIWKKTLKTKLESPLCSPFGTPC
jgi:hypothetical protein